MIGKTISYSPASSLLKTKLHHTLYGRILTKTYRTKLYAYYRLGILHNIPFMRLGDSKVFVENLNNIDVDLLKVFGDIIIEDSEQGDKAVKMETGHEHWLNIAKERGLVLKYPKNKRLNGTT